MIKSKSKKTTSLKQAIFERGSDTRGRSLDVAAVLQSLSIKGKLLLDAGCGENGLNNYATAANVISTDLNIFKERIGDPKFICSSIAELPFADSFFPITATVDVLEHLAVDIREAGVAELVRVTKEAVVMAFPAGQTAREIDENFQAKLAERKKPTPSWVEEHLQHPYPLAENIISVAEKASEKYSKKIRSIKLYYSEPIKITKTLRWTASKSKILYIATNSLLGLLLPLIPKPRKNNSYRTIVVIEFEIFADNRISDE